ncbi:MAG: hypothetical protein ACRDE5_13055, partial [Ginsengibacter sp.]
MNTKKDNKVNLTKESELSRRKFITATSVLLAGAAFKLKASGISGIADNEPEPIIDMHQHSNYVGRYDNQYLAAHQRNMG